MNGFRATAWRTDARTDARMNGRESLGLQRLRRETKKPRSRAGTLADKAGQRKNRK